MIDQIIAYNILSSLMGDGYKAVVRGFIIDSETGTLEEIN